MTISYEKIKIFAFAYIILPLMCFFLFYMSSMVGFGCFIVICVLCYMLIRQYLKEKNVYSEDAYLSYKTLCLLLIIALIWSFLGGQGNHYYQSSDWGCRNAIFRDLIYMDWPVIYKEYGRALVYYIGYWLPSASLVKIIGKIFPSIYSSELAFQIGNQFLWIWTTIGIFLLEVLLYSYVKPNSKIKKIALPVILVFFSGLDIVGVINKIVTEHKIFDTIHIEWWMDGMQFSSITTCLFWVFNQAVIPWIVIMCFLQEKDTQNYVLLGVCALVSGPLPFLGVFVYMILYAIVLFYNAIKKHVLKEFTKHIFSLKNILSLLLIPVIYMYYQANSAVNMGTEAAERTILGIIRVVDVDESYLKNVLFFLLVEVGFYFIPIFGKYKKNPLYYISMVIAIMSPFFAVGLGSDFIMRFSIPMIIVLMTFVIKYIYDNNMSRISRYILIIFLLIGSITPLTEFFRGYNAMLTTGKIANVYDDIITMNREEKGYNFTTKDYDSKIFFKYLLK